MAVPSVLLDMNMNELRKAFYSIADQPSLQILVLLGSDAYSKSRASRPHRQTNPQRLWDAL